jgi:transposase
MSGGYIRGVDRQQRLFLPECVEDYVGPGNPVRIIDAFVESMRRGGEDGCLPQGRMMGAEGGRPSYCPKTMAKLFIWGYLNKVVSTRSLEREAHRNLELIWLLGSLRPDHSSISRFRADHAKRIKRWLKEFNLTCAKLGLIGGEEIAVDSVRLKAVNSKRNCHTQQQLKERLAKLSAKIDQYIEDLGKAEHEEEGARQECDLDDLRSKLQELEEAKASVAQMLQAAEESPTGQLCTVDPDARLLSRRNKGNSVVGYLAQSAVDSKAHLILATEVTQANSDFGQLTSMVEAALETVPPPENVAEPGSDAPAEPTQTAPSSVRVLGDSGYFAIADLAKCEERGWEVYVAVPEKGHAKSHQLYSISDFHHDPETDSYQCPQAQKLTRHGDYTKDAVTYFTYYNTEACRACPVRAECTKGKYRKIHRHSREDVVERIRQRITENPEVYPRRQATVEHPFGSMMFWNQGRNLLCRRLGKANAEFTLSALAYNVKRAIKAVGVKALLEAFRRLMSAIWLNRRSIKAQERDSHAFWLTLEPFFARTPVSGQFTG